MYDIDQACRILIENIRNICTQKRITMTSLARRSDISQSTLSDLFKGRTKPQIYTLFKICNALDISIEKLFEGIVIKEVRIDARVGNQKKEQIAELILEYESLTEEKKKLLELYIDMLREYDNIEKIEKTIMKSKKRAIHRGDSVIR